MNARFIHLAISLAGCACFLILQQPLVRAAAPPTDQQLGELAAQAAKYESGQNRAALQQLEILAGQATQDPALQAKVEASLDALLAPSATFEARRSACVLLSAMGTAVSVEPLAKLLSDDATVEMACVALRNIPSPKASEALQAALTSAKGHAAVQILQTLGDRAEPAAVASIKARLVDADDAVVEAALTGLAKIGSPDAVAAIVAAKTGLRPALQPAMNEALLRAGERLATGDKKAEAAALFEDLLKSSDAASVRRGAFTALLRQQKDGGLERIKAVLGQNDPVLKPVALAAVASLPGKSVSGIFAKELPKLAPNEQAWLLQSLALRGDGGAKDAIRKAVTSTEPEVRQAALTALAQDGTGAIPTLVAALAKGVPAGEAALYERAAAGLKGGFLTDQLLAKAVTKAPPSAQSVLLSALGRRGASSTVSDILKAGTSTNSQVTGAAFQALSRIGDTSALPGVLDVLKQPKESAIREQAETAAQTLLAKSGTGSSLLTQAWQSSTLADARASLLRLMPSAPSAQTLGIVKEAMQSSEPMLKDTAQRALTEWPDIGAWKDLSSLLDGAGSESVRSLALRGLTRLAGDEASKGAPGIAAKFQELVGKAKGASDLKSILGGLSQGVDASLLPIAQQLLSNPSVKAEAEQALKKIVSGMKAKDPASATQALDKLGLKLQ